MNNLRYAGVVAGLLFSVASANAQNTKAQMTTEINTNLPNNTTGAITPAVLRSTMNDMVSSYVATQEVSNILIGTLIAQTANSQGVAMVAADMSPTQAGAELVFGSAHTDGYTWIQSFNGLPLYLNPLGNLVQVGVPDGLSEIPNTYFKVDGDGAVISSHTTTMSTAPRLFLRNRKAATQVVGQIDFQTQNSIGTYTNGVYMSGGLFDWTAGAEQGDLDIGVLVSGTPKVIAAVRGDIPGIAPDTASAYDIGTSVLPYRTGYFKALNLVTGAQSNIRAGQWGADATYNAISLNGTLAGGSIAGLVSGNTGDATLYAVSSGHIIMRPSGSSSNLYDFDDAGLTSAAGIAWSVLDSTQSTNTTTGAVKITGGLGVAKRLVVGESVTTGTATLTPTTGAMGLSKTTLALVAPGAGGGAIQLVCGTNGGTAKLIAYAGTSLSPTTLLDNIGSGVSGC